MSYLKGVATIQLFDAETGELQQEVKEENMITNVIEEVLNPPDYFSSGLDVNEDRSIRMVNRKNSILNNFFNGILIFEKPIEENVKNVMAPFDNMEIGHAGDTTSVEHNHQGSYNTTESGNIENGYRRVWDFGTDRANGTISCVCLTSRAGGTIGEYRQQAYQMGGGNFTSSTEDDAENVFCIKYDNTGNKNVIGNIFYIEKQNDGNIKCLIKQLKTSNIYECILGDPFKQKLNSFSCTVISWKKVFTLGEQKYDYYDWLQEGHTSDPGEAYCYNQLAMRRSEKLVTYQFFSPYVYQNKIHIVCPLSTRVTVSIKHMILNLDTYAIEQDKVIEVETAPIDYYRYFYHSSTNDNPPAYYDDTLKKWVYPRGCYYSYDNTEHVGGFFFDNHYFYISSNQHLIVADKQGKTVQTMNNCDLTNVYIDEVNDYVLIGEGTNSHRKGVYLLKKNKNEQYQCFWHSLSCDYDSYNGSSGFGAPAKVKEAHAPFYCIASVWNQGSADYDYFKIYFGHLYTFLSTINNLSTSVIKTNGQTMKITYDIIQVEE